MMLLMIPFRMISQERDYNGIIAPGNISGYVINYYGLAISGATVGIEDGPLTTSGADGSYFLEGVESGERTLGCGKPGYNPVIITVEIISGDTLVQNFTLPQPSMVINPLNIAETVNPGEYLSKSLNILNGGSGPLEWQAVINFESMPVFPCTYSIALYDTWGDGWSGCSLDVLVNDSVVLDNITLSTGSGPATFYFPVYAGDQVTTDFSPGPFFTEPYYFIYDSEGEQVWFSPAGNNGPPDVLAGQLVADCAGGQWLTLDEYEGEVQPFGGVDNVITHLDAAGTDAGDVYQAEILFTSFPFVGEITIPVTMTVVGNGIVTPENFIAELDDAVTGKVDLSWDWNGDAFQFFLIKRDGSIIATTTSQGYTDLLPDYGYYCYTVQAVYNEGLTSPAGPECVEWPNPVLAVDPAELEGSVWPDYKVDVFTTVSNSGEGTLAYSFPEFAAIKLLHDPGLPKNMPGLPPGLASTGLFKGNNTQDGAGYPIVLGAGGPDDFGYVWIDSDEDGGPGYNFTDISTTGTPVFGLSDDNIVGPYNIGFDFYFYNESKTQFWVNSNGCVGFTSTKITLQNTGIPTNSSFYNDFIAWMWDDMVFRPGTSQVFYRNYPDKLIIQFKNYSQFDEEGRLINAEVILYKNGRIKLIYDDFTPGTELKSCTIGLQSSDPETGLQVLFNTIYLHNDLTILFSLPSEFITDVEPVSGTVPQGGSEVVTITYDAEDYNPGTFHEDLLMETNDLRNPEFVVTNTMYVYLPAKYSGNVLDDDNGEPLNGVLVTAGPFQATTGENGEYSLMVDEGNYDVVFSKLGYMPVTIEDTSSAQGLDTPLDITMFDMNYAPGTVHAEVMDNSTWCMITWSMPDGPYEIVLDDGEAEDFFVFSHAGSWHAVKFTPAGYPSKVIGGSFYVGDGSFPGPFLGTDFGVAVFDDDGVNGLPGTMLDSNGVTVNNSGWVSLDWMNAEITEGSFYLAMYQAGNAPNTAPIGVDNGSPVHFKSYSKFLENDWTLSPYQDFMIRAWINGPESDDLAGNAGVTPISNRDVVSYNVARYLEFDPEDPPAGGVFSQMAITQNLYYNDLAIDPNDYGWRCYGVRALYTSGEYSDYTLSNVIGLNNDVNVTVTTTLTSGDEPSGVEVTLSGLDYPHETFLLTTGPDGIASFDTVWKGKYNIRIYKIGYEAYLINEVELTEDEEYNIILSTKKYPPRNLFVDPVSAIATWDPPLRTAVLEDFEDDDFPPPGWQVRTADPGYGWFRSNNASSQGFVIPPWDGYYAVVNNDTAGSENNGCCDYLITPPVDLRESDGYVLNFDSFYNGAFGQLAFVEYSLDEGGTWEVLYQVTPDTSWAKLELDLSAFSGENGPPQVWLAFHSDNNQEWTSGWAIDNVAIQVPAPAADYLDFSVFLDDVYVGSTSQTKWDFAPLPYGQTYTVSVAAHYSSGLSPEIFYTFTSKYLFPPENLTGDAPDDAAILTWDPPGPTKPLNLMGYNVYRDDVFVTYLEHIGNWQMQGFVEKNLDPGIYDYSVTGVYDLTPYGLPGESGESMKAGPEDVTVDYCNELEFFETWEIGGFKPNDWKTEGSNWSINGQAGNPAPSAEFTYAPLQTDYEIALESYPLCAAGITEGQIWLDFDLELFSLQPTGEEMMRIQVWNWISKDWVTVAEFSNSNGNIPLTKEHLNISYHAINSIFKVRFQAKGVNSADIRGWFVDNVHIYRHCIEPKNLEADPYFYEGIRLTWELNEKSRSEGGSGTRELNGFNLYGSVNGGDYELLPYPIFGNSFIIPDTSLETGNLYCFKVSALWESETDQCESGLSNETCVLWTGTEEATDPDQAGFRLYPNPATDRIFISSEISISRISISHVSGSIVYERNMDDKELEINLGGLSAGIYIVKAETAKGTFSRLLTILR